MGKGDIPEHFRQRIREAKENHLEELDLSSDYGTDDNDKLTQIPEEVFDLKYLKVLKLNYNKISGLPEYLDNLTSLTKLDLWGNQISDLPESLGNLARLTSLNLRGNQISDLPESLGNLTSLSLLDLSRNQISDLPESLGNLTSLSLLDLSRNQISDLPESLGNLTNLTQLSLGRNKLTSLPESLGNLTNLTQLNLGRHQLIYLPESLDRFTDLNFLVLSSNQISELPESLGKLTKLTQLDLSRNKLSELPQFIGNLTNLTSLDLSENKLSELPQFIGNLTNLTSLFLSVNQISELPESLGKLTKLTQLDLSRNKLSELPQFIGNLTNLFSLDISKNNISYLPEFLVDLTDLFSLDVVSNPLIEPPVEIINKGTRAIKSYLRQRKETGLDYIYEAKLLIVGEGGAGKTTLAKKIDNSEYELREQEKSTEGIDVIKWSFPILDKEKKIREFQVNIWDFGGQEIYHATHQFFLTKRSLYALVVDTRKEDTDFYYWLNVVELLSNNSPLLIIKNEKQDRKREINELALRGQFTNLKEVLATNLADNNRGLDSIITNIQNYIKNLPLIGQALPKTWVKVRQTLEQDDRNYISLQEYLDICEANGFAQLEDKLHLSGYLHDLGVCLHFQDEEDSLLYRTVILKPEWGTDAVYKVLDNKQVFNSQGRFNRDDLKTIWHEKKYAERTGELLELMKKFQLCYQIPGKKNSFIAPQLLSDNQPDYDWDESNNLILRYAYPNFMPKGIITRFIVEMHQYIDKQKYVWKSGVILAKDTAKAEVIEYYGKREIKVRVMGNNQKKLMTILAHELDKINDSYNRRLNYQKLIPCNCETCNGSQKPFFYELKKLEERRSNRKRTIECGNPPYINVKVLSLIDDIFLPTIPESIDNNFDQENNSEILELAKMALNRPVYIENRATAGDNINQSGSNIGMGINNGETTAKNITGNNNQAPSQNYIPSQENTTHNDKEKPAANPWNLGNKLALIGILVAVIFGLFSGLFTEEGRKLLNLDQQEQPEQINELE